MWRFINGVSEPTKQKNTDRKEYHGVDDKTKRQRKLLESRKTNRPWLENAEVGKYILAGFLGFTGYNWWLICQTKRYNKMLQLENTEANIALEPLMIAENDRLTLKLFRQNCELEEELMQNKPDWQVGTLYGEPIYHDVRKRGLMPKGYELYSHSNLISGKEVDRKYFVKAQGAYFEQLTRKNPEPPE